jgi:hypothetical protein
MLASWACRHRTHPPTPKKPCGHCIVARRQRQPKPAGVGPCMAGLVAQHCTTADHAESARTWAAPPPNPSRCLPKTTRLSRLCCTVLDGLCCPDRCKPMGTQTAEIPGTRAAEQEAAASADSPAPQCTALPTLGLVHTPWALVRRSSCRLCCWGVVQCPPGDLAADRPTQGQAGTHPPTLPSTPWPETPQVCSDLAFGRHRLMLRQPATEDHASLTTGGQRSDSPFPPRCKHVVACSTRQLTPTRLCSVCVNKTPPAQPPITTSAVLPHTCHHMR